MTDTHPHCHQGEACQAPEACVDASVRCPFTLLFANALRCLVGGSALSFLAAIQLVIPGFLAGIPFLTYGRLAPAARDILLYGWASQAAIATGIWLMTRLCGRPLGGPILRTLINSAVVLWNLAVVLGTLAILAGYSTGTEWLEYPGWASAMLLLSFLMIGVWVVCLFGSRIGERAETALWYLVAGFCCFPWVYGTANLLLVWKPVPASAQGAIQAWYCNGLILLWLLPVALAALYALLPRLSGNHLHCRSVAPLGFWLLLLLGGWSGLSLIIGGPIPAWMTATGVVTGVFILIPILVVIVNLAPLPCHEDSVVWHFLRKGLFFTLIAAVLVALLALPPVSAICQFTGMTASRNVLWLLAAISFPLFAVLYKGIAGLRGYDSWCHCLAQTHLWLAFTGVCFLVGTMFLEGLFTGLAMNDAVVTFRNVTSYAFPFHVLQMVGWLIFFVSTLLVGANFIRAIACKGITPSK